FYYRRSQTIFQELNDKQGLATAYNKIGEIYEQSGKFQDALNMQWKCLSLTKTLNSSFLMTFAYASMSVLHLKMHHKDSAILYAEEGMKIAYTHQSAERLAHLQTVSAACYNANQEYEMAYEYASEAKKTAKKLGAVEYYVGACEQYYLASKALGNYQEALIEYENFVHLKDSIQGAKNQRIVLAKEFAYEESRIKVAQHKKEIQHQLETAQQRQVMYSLGGMVVALIIILLLVYKNSRDKQKLNNLLHQKREIIEHKNQELEDANATKDKLFSIIGHDLRSPLASLKSLLGLATDGTVTTAELQMLLPSLQKNVESIYDTLENLLQWSYSQMQGIRSNPSVFDITQLIESNLQLFTEAAKNKQIALQTNVKEVIKVRADEQQILLVLRNLIINAIIFTKQGGEFN
ncbi:MAG: histidine kinase dimerization/phospho-acceptor domain-containing protein, partial [Thermoflexibacteraceae bacterium]